MKKVRYRMIIVLILLAIGFFIGLQLKEDKIVTGIKVNKWDNIYTEKNIKLYYNNSNIQALDELNKKYNLNKIVSGTTDQFDKSLKILNWINENMKYDSDIKANVSNKGAFDILEGENKKESYSDEEISIVFNEFALAAGITSRIGQLTVSNDEKGDGEKTLSICEIWSDKYNKWIMIDPSNGNYLLDKDTPVSAIEIINKSLDNLTVIGGKSEKKYKKDLQKYFHSYTIKIDNGVYGKGKSNSYISYAKGININKLGVDLNLSQPTIFLSDSYLFNLSPKEDYTIENSNEKSTIIFMNKVQQTEKDEKDEKDENVKMELTAGVFKNSSMLNKYYISINGGPFKEEGAYFNVQVKTGITNIKLSEDGKTAIREITMEYVDEQ